MNQRESSAAEKRPASQAVYLRMDRDMVRWLDEQAKRQRRSRAYVMDQACRMLKAVIAELNAERP